MATVGADAHWLAALGGWVVKLGDVPPGVPYAAAPSDGWSNVPILGELFFHALEAGLGDRGLVLALVGATALALGFIAFDMRRDDVADAPSALVLLLVAVGAASSLLIVRGQIFSLALFPVLLYILRSQARAPGEGIWLVVPLFALWSNLHGGVLVGVAVAGAYLLFNRLLRTPLEALGVLAASLAALFLTPALLDTGAYYHGVLGSEAASGREGLWAPHLVREPAGPRLPGGRDPAARRGDALATEAVGARRDGGARHNDRPVGAKRRLARDLPRDARGPLADRLSRVAAPAPGEADRCGGGRLRLPARARPRQVRRHPRRRASSFARRQRRPRTAGRSSPTT